MKENLPNCPKCGSKKVVRIIYGFVLLLLTMFIWDFSKTKISHFIQRHIL